ncbi:MAG TPA: methyltransferase domain-containing protein [Gemmatimonadales bacterium]|nr:methyltransferase domain-containing protein [Gemmatimonadales bacterium]
MTLPPPTAPSAAWSHVARNYHKYIVPGFRPASRALCDALRIGSGDRVLDVACGPGTLALEAARLGAAQVTGVDFSAEMIALARRDGAGLGQVEFLEGEATALPVLSESFDVAASAFGIIFSPHPRAAVADLHRTVVPGGRAGILSWSRSGTTGEYYEKIYHHIPRLDASHDPYDWGVRGQARKWFGEWFGYLEFQMIEVPFTAPSAREAWEVLRVSTGRVALAYEKLDPSARQRMDAEMIEYFGRYTSDGGQVYWPREALMMTGTK